MQFDDQPKYNEVNYFKQDKFESRFYIYLYKLTKLKAGLLIY